MGWVGVVVVEVYRSSRCRGGSAVVGLVGVGWLGVVGGGGRVGKGRDCHLLHL